MAKKHKKKKRIYSYEERTAAQNAVTDKVKHFNFRLAFTMLGIFAILAGVYALLLRLRFLWATPILYLFAAALFLAFFFINRGFSRKPLDRALLPASWSEEKKTDFIKNDIERKAFAKKVMVVLVPVLLLVGIDILLTLVFPSFL